MVDAHSKLKDGSSKDKQEGIGVGGEDDCRYGSMFLLALLLYLKEESVVDKETSTYAIVQRGVCSTLLPPEIFGLCNASQHPETTDHEEVAFLTRKRRYNADGYHGKDDTNDHARQGLFILIVWAQDVGIPS